MKTNTETQDRATVVEVRDVALEYRITLAELAYLAGANREMVEEMLDLDLIEPCTREPEMCFAVEVLPRVRRMLRLHHHVGVDFNSMELVLDLLDRIEALEQELERR
jgi:hypothetical protein